MPCAADLLHELHDLAVRLHEIMAGNLAFVPTEPVKRALGTRHARIMQQDHIGLAAISPFAMVRRGLDARLAVVCLE
jgi:hypothetical protein